MFRCRSRVRETDGEHVWQGDHGRIQDETAGWLRRFDDCVRSTKANGESVQEQSAEYFPAVFVHRFLQEEKGKDGRVWVSRAMTTVWSRARASRQPFVG